MIQNNKLTRFDAEVFQPMLLQMVNGIGTLFASGSMNAILFYIYLIYILIVFIT